MSWAASRRAVPWLVAACAILGAASSAGADVLEELEARQKAVFARVAPSVVYIEVKEGIGSGFFVAEGLVLTNSHVVGKARAVKVLLRDGREVKGRVVERAGGDVDLALVEVPVRDIKPLPLSPGALAVGQWVASVGHGVNSPWTFTTGMVSNIYNVGENRPVFQTQIPLNPGSSGGPIVDRQGRVVGIATAGITDANTVNFAIRAAVALARLPRLSRHCACLVIEAPAGVPVLVDGRLAGKGPRLYVEVARGAHTVEAVVGRELRKRSVRYPDTRSVDLR